MPIFGLGCVAGAAGIARAADYVRAYPDQVAVLLSVELCSLTLQTEDLSIPNLIASGLFGDGAAAAVVVGAERAAAPPEPAAGPEVVATRSVFYRDSERVMGWDISESGFQIVLSADVPEVVREHLRADVDAFLAEHGLTRTRHRLLGLPPRRPQGAGGDGGGARARARSARRHLAEPARGRQPLLDLGAPRAARHDGRRRSDHRPPAGTLGMLLAMGPGFCSELVLLRW